MNPLEQQMMLGSTDMPEIDPLTGKPGAYPRRAVQEVNLMNQPAPIQSAMEQPVAQPSMSQQPIQWAPLDPVGQAPMQAQMAPAQSGGSPIDAAMLMKMGGAMMSEKNGVQGIGKAFSVGGEHLDYQAQVKAAREKANEDRELRREQLEDRKALTKAKVANLATKSAKLGAPKIIDNGNGMMTAVFTDPVTNEVTFEAITNQEAKEFALLEETGKGLRAQQMAEAKKEAKADEPLNSTAQKAIDDGQQSIIAGTSIAGEAARIVQNLDSGKLKLGPVKNIVNMGKSNLGMGDAESVAYDDFTTTIQDMRAKMLLLHNGVATKSDADQALQAILANPRDEASVRMNMEKLNRLNQQAIKLQQERINQVRLSNGKPAATFSETGMIDPTSVAQGAQAPQAPPQAPQVAPQGASPSDRAKARRAPPEIKQGTWQGKPVEMKYSPKHNAYFFKTGRKLPNGKDEWAQE